MNQTVKKPRETKSLFTTSVVEICCNGSGVLHVAGMAYSKACSPSFSLLTVKKWSVNKNQKYYVSCDIRIDPLFRV